MTGPTTQLGIPGIGRDRVAAGRQRVLPIGFVERKAVSTELDGLTLTVWRRAGGGDRADDALPDDLLADGADLDMAARWRAAILKRYPPTLACRADRGARDLGVKPRTFRGWIEDGRGPRAENIVRAYRRWGVSILAELFDAGGALTDAVAAQRAMRDLENAVAAVGACAGGAVATVSIRGKA